MSIHRDRVYEGYEAVCDTQGCGAWEALHVSTQVEMGRRLREKGWRAEERTCHCPRCMGNTDEEIRP